MDLASMGGWPSVLGTITGGRDLTSEQARAAMEEVLSGEATDAQIAALIVGLRVKGEAVDEVLGMVDAMLAAAAEIKLPPDASDAIDIVGTGGAPNRRAHALNVSTMACFVAAGAGVKVCKHGNRKASSTSGSFDLLEALGIANEVGAPVVLASLGEAGIGFCFARSFHPAMRHAAAVRSELGVPTIFNLLGPLSHPARVRRQVIGVSDLRVAPLVSEVLLARGSPRAMVVHGGDGMDELTTTTTTTVLELRDGSVRTYEVDPTDLGLPRVEPEQVRGGDAKANAAIAESVLGGEHGPHRDIVLLNAAAGIVVSGAADTLVQGLEAATDSIDSGRAAAKVDALRTSLRSLESADPAGGTPA